jgi:hypothetical protein
MRVFVLDAMSRDRTVEFARAGGAEVVERPWNGFVDARAFALASVKTPWTLMLDADEALDDALRDALLAATGKAEGYVVRRTTFYCGKPLRMWRREPLLRVFRTDRARLEAHGAAANDAALHERWRCDGPVEELAGTLLHYSYPDAASYRAKFARYTEIEASALRFSWPRVVAQWLLVWPRWAWLLVRRGALLDGARGIVASYWSARYPYVVAKKAR